MSRAVALHIAEHQDTNNTLTRQTIFGTISTEPIDATVTLSEIYLSKVQGTSGFEIGHLLDGQARSAAALFYSAAPLLFRPAIVPVNLLSSLLTLGLLREEDPWEEDSCIEMPPRFIRVRYMGQAKPLPLDLDDVLDVLEEEDPWEEDPCIEMPPLSVEKVVVNVRDMGRAKPLEYLDDILEDE